MKNLNALAFPLALCAIFALCVFPFQPSAAAAQDPNKTAPTVEEELARPMPIAVVASENPFEEDHGFLGVYFSGSEKKGGALIDKVIEGTPAQKAGMKDGDLLVSLNGKAVNGQDDVIAILSTMKGGDTLKYAVKRGEESVDGVVILVSRDDYLKKNNVIVDEAELKKQLEAHAEAMKPLGKLKGIETLESLKKLGYIGRGSGKAKAAPKSKAVLGVQIAQGENTVLISSVIKNSPAVKADLFCGDRIISVNGKEVETIKNLTDCMAKVKPGKAVLIKLLRGNKIIKKKVKTGHAGKVLGQTGKNTKVIDKFLDGSTFGFRAAPIVTDEGVHAVVVGGCESGCGTKCDSGCGKECSQECDKECDSDCDSKCDVKFDVECNVSCDTSCGTKCHTECHTVTYSVPGGSFTTDRYVTLSAEAGEDGLLSIVCSDDDEHVTSRTIAIPGGEAKIMVIGGDEAFEDVKVIEKDGKKFIIKKSHGTAPTDLFFSESDLHEDDATKCYCNKCTSKKPRFSSKRRNVMKWDDDVMRWHGRADQDCGDGGCRIHRAPFGNAGCSGHCGQGQAHRSARGHRMAKPHHPRHGGCCSQCQGGHRQPAPRRQHGQYHHGQNHHGQNHHGQCSGQCNQKAAPPSCQGGCGCGNKGGQVYKMTIPHPGHDCCSQKGNNVYFHGPARGGAHGNIMFGAPGKAHTFALPHGQHAEIICDDGDCERRVIVVKPGQKIEKLPMHKDAPDTHEHAHDGLP